MAKTKNLITMNLGKLNTKYGTNRNNDIRSTIFSFFIAKPSSFLNREYRKYR